MPKPPTSRTTGWRDASGNGCANSLVCPYRAWVYRLGGQLWHVPDEYGFPCLDKSTLGLVEVGAQERAGLVFVTQDDPIPGASLDDLPPALVGEDQSLVSASERIVDVNWKVFVEGQLHELLDSDA